MSALLEAHIEDRMGILPQSPDAEGALEAATRLVADAASRRDAPGLTRLRDELRAGVATWSAYDPTHYCTGRAVQLLASANASLQRVPGPDLASEVRAKPRMHELLASVASTGEASSRELISRMGVDGAQVSRAGRRLVGLGLLTRAQDGKQVWWEITDRGREVLRTVEADGARKRRLTNSRVLTVPAAEALLRRAQHAARKSEVATAAMVARQGPQPLAERVLLVHGVRHFATGTPEFLFPDPERPMSDRRHIVWQSLSEVAPRREIEAFQQGFWPADAPHYDACAIVPGDNGRGGIVVIDARVSPAEFFDAAVTPRTAVQKRAISRAIKSTRDYLGVTKSAGWRRYQDPAQRLAFLFGLQEHLSAPIWMMNLYFIPQPSHSLLPSDTPASIEAWYEHIDPLRRQMELAQGHRMQASIGIDFLLEPQSSMNLEAIEVSDQTQRLTARQHVVRSGGKWEVITHPDAPRPLVVTDKQTDAIAEATSRLRQHGGGELVVHDRDGRVRLTDAIE